MNIAVGTDTIPTMKKEIIIIYSIRMTIRYHKRKSKIKQQKTKIYFKKNMHIPILDISSQT